MSDFASRLIAWQKSHGRHDLPWQNTRDPYRIWISEIMLQQTQVATVIPYYQRFMTHFPSIASLASADEEAVLTHWSGLGYYARARNLHAAARQIVARHQGVFPASVEAITALPGIGPSTAAAIAAFAFGVRGAILDGNVKRVLTRCFGIEGFPGDKAVEAKLWTLAESLLPEAEIERYTQGLMDLGATLCTRAQPRCGDCPLSAQCVARRDDRIAQLPAPKRKKTIPERQTVMLILRRGNEVLLEKRPAQGVWGGLWSFPEVAPEAVLNSHLQTRFGVQAARVAAMSPLVHTFTHFRLTIRVLVVWVNKPGAAAGAMWLDRFDAHGAALPTPVRRLLDLLD
ncbi:MAG: A/G-specific adenine glycosylase [Hydrogenophilales bacterium]|nr:A/G-specific adenine glycosylase [Hydrogenophilales bacterium]